MGSSGVSGFGTILTWHTADIAELTSISGPSETRSVIDLTSHESGTGAYKEFCAGLGDGGEISFEGNFIYGDTPGQIVMHTDFQLGATEAWIIKHPTWTAGSQEYPQISGNGIITALSINPGLDDKISISGTIKVTGKPDLAVA